MKLRKLIITMITLMMILYIIPKEDLNTTEQVSVQVSKQVTEQVTSRSLEEPRNEPQIITPTEISQIGIDLIKQFERL